MSNTEREDGAAAADELDETEPGAGGPLEEEHVSLLEMILAEGPGSPPALAARVDGVVVGRVTSVDASGAVRVTFPGAPPEGFPARAMTTLVEADKGIGVALLFEGGDPRKPCVMGKMVSPLAAGVSGEAEAAADGRRVEISAEQEIVLRCGESSITLTRSGKIILRGAYVLSRSSGVNRIQGGSVQIN